MRACPSLLPPVFPFRLTWFFSPAPSDCRPQSPGWRHASTSTRTQGASVRLNNVGVVAQSPFLAASVAYDVFFHAPAIPLPSPRHNDADKHGRVVRRLVEQVAKPHNYCGSHFMDKTLFEQKIQRKWWAVCLWFRFAANRANRMR